VASGGIAAPAKARADPWIAMARDRWIGNAPWCIVSIILGARDIADNQVKGFIVGGTRQRPAFSVEKIENKIARRWFPETANITLMRDVSSDANDQQKERRVK